MLKGVMTAGTALLGVLMLSLGCANPTARLGDGTGTLTVGKTEAGQCVDTLLLPTTGLYAVTPLNRQLDESVVATPSLSGISIRVGWSALQPSAQEPDFSLIDAQLALARKYNKKVSLSIEAGIETPDWVYSLGARPFSFVLDESAGERVCQRVRMPIPWDPVYLDSFRSLIRAASRRYNRSSLLTHIKVTGISSTGQAAALPHAAAQTISTKTKLCTTSDELTAWLDVGYSRPRVVQSFRELIELFSQSFTSHRIAVVIDAKGFPPVGERGALLAGAAYDIDIVPELLKLAIAGRESRVLIQSNELTNTSTYPFPIQFGEQITIGYQLRWPVTDDKAARMNGGTHESPVAVFDGAVRKGVVARARYLEVQPEDIKNPQLSSSLAGARVLLRRGSR